MRLDGFKVLTFDVYGTLIDWETGLHAALAPIAARAGRPLSRDEVLDGFAAWEIVQQRSQPAMRYTDLLAIVARRLAEEWEVRVSWEECQAFGRTVPHWPAFADTVDALRYLSGHFRLAVLSNVDNASLAAAFDRLGLTLDAAYSAEDIGSYKPDLRNFRYMLAALQRRGYGPDDILHVAQSLVHDHGPANELGIANCWIDRRHGRDGAGATGAPERMPRFAFRFDSLAELAAAHRAERAGG
ncbi:MAG: haloacid dehalogenase type II [Sneathiellaceae bacterium]